MDRATLELTVVGLTVAFFFVIAVVISIIFFRVMRQESREQNQSPKTPVSPVEKEINKR